MHGIACCFVVVVRVHMLIIVILLVGAVVLVIVIVAAVAVAVVLRSIWQVRVSVLPAIPEDRVYRTRHEMKVDRTDYKKFMEESSPPRGRNRSIRNIIIAITHVVWRRIVIPCAHS